MSWLSGKQPDLNDESRPAAGAAFLLVRVFLPVDGPGVGPVFDVLVCFGVPLVVVFGGGPDGVGAADSDGRGYWHPFDDLLAGRVHGCSYFGRVFDEHVVAAPPDHLCVVSAVSFAYLHVWAAAWSVTAHVLEAWVRILGHDSIFAQMHLALPWTSRVL